MYSIKRAFACPIQGHAGSGVTLSYRGNEDEEDAKTFFAFVTCFFLAQPQLVACPPTVVLTSQGNRVLA